MKKVLNIFVEGVSTGDAITANALRHKQWLRDLGYDCRLYALHIHPDLRGEVLPVQQYVKRSAETHLVYHHSIGSDLVPKILEMGLRLIMVYHNITPSSYFAALDPAWAARAELGRAQLAQLQPITELALAVSDYNAQELITYGYDSVDVLPLVLDDTLPESNPLLAAHLEQTDAIKLLFVGRLSPNKKQEDLIKLLWCLKQIRPKVHLYLVGDRWAMHYDKWVESLAAELNLSAAVTLTGKVSDEDMFTYYRHCDFYVSMSEHEGFGRPLIESMISRLPVLAFSSSGIPATMGDVGIQFEQKQYQYLAELIDWLANNLDFCQRLTDKQYDHTQQFLSAAVSQRFRALISAVL